MFHAQNVSAGVIAVANKAGVPVVLSTTDFWFVCPIVQLKRPDGQVCRGPGEGAKNCLTCFTPKLFPLQNEFEEAFTSRYPGPAKRLSSLPAPIKNTIMKGIFGAYKASKMSSAVQATTKRPAVLRELANSTKAIMVPTKLMRDIFVENGIDSQLIKQVPFGIDTKPLLGFRHKKPSKTVRFGYIGTLFEHKGVDLLIDAFQQLPDAANTSLTIYGNLQQFPEYGKQLLAMTKQELLDQEKITFAGTFPNEKLGEVLSEIDVLVVPSRWYENTPLVIQSALTCKTPLIATDLGGMSEIINHGVNGLLFGLNDAKDLAAKMLSLIDKPQLIEDFRANIPEERDISQMVDDIEVIYKQSLPLLIS
jgi:glycosyltransferase involved in cell wall biosynthesis